MQKNEGGYNTPVEHFRDDEYPMLRGSVYLDHAGTTPYAKSLMDQFARDMTTNLFGNPHSTSPSSQLSTFRIEDTRLRVLQFFNADPTEFDVVFVANATAGIKLVAEAVRSVPGGFDYVYHQASHTSLVGLREEARNSHCLAYEEVEDWLVGGVPFPTEDGEGPLLFAYPAQSNMDGRRFPLAWADRARRRPTPETASRVYTLLDAAALVSSSPLDLSCAETAPDFTVLSFYKIFGFPDLGALIVRRDAEDAFDSRRYFGGGTVDMVVCVKERWHAPKTQSLHERLEDGTLPIHSIIALDAALDTHARLFGSMADIASHTSFLAKHLYDGLASTRHGNGKPVCTIYSPGPHISSSGPVIAFNLRNSLGAWISLTEIEKLATLKGFHIRTGGVCNPGGISSSLGLQPWEMRKNFFSGFRCGTENDIMGGKPTGVVRVSLGAMSTISDVDSFVGFVREFYVDRSVASAAPTPPSQARGPSDLRVHAICVFPIKSCGGFEVPVGVEWEIRPEGLAWDREWCLIHQGSGQVLSQKRYPRMSLLRPTLDFELGELQVSYTGHTPTHIPSSITVPLSQNPALFQSSPSRSRYSRVCGEEIVAQAYSSQETNAFFSAVLGVPCVLARFPAGGQGKSMRHAKAHLSMHQVASPVSMPGSFPAPPSPPDSDSEPERRILLSNESPILAITTASVDELNQEIRRNGGKDVSPAVFRANIIISDPQSRQLPYVEDSWTGLQIGTHDFETLGACRRCHMVCINQGTAEKSEEPFVTLSKTRRFDGKVFFGTHMCYAPKDQTAAIISQEAQFPTVRVGDSVRVEW
ncbi:hypothetical protein OQA88_3690 [Cercophora sp. LCS_1]